jgi:hypothetical protein
MPMPDKLKRGEYKFNEETIAHVRLIRGYPLVFFDGKWDELAPFILQKIKEDVEAKSPHKASIESTAEPEVNIAEVKQQEEPQPEEEEMMPEPEPEPEQKDTKNEDLAAQRKRNEVEAKKEFFFLTALAVKMSSEMREDVCMISNQDLYDKAIEDNIEFFKYYEWIKTELLKSYLESSRKERFKSMGKTDDGVDDDDGKSNLRGQRVSVMSSLARREMLKAAKDKETSARAQFQPSERFSQSANDSNRPTIIIKD